MSLLLHYITSHDIEICGELNHAKIVLLLPITGKITNFFKGTDFFNLVFISTSSTYKFKQKTNLIETKCRLCQRKTSVVANNRNFRFKRNITRNIWA